MSVELETPAARLAAPASLLARPGALAQAVRFLVVGGASYVLNMTLYSLGLWLGLHYMVAAIVAYVIGFAFNFLANRHWTFAAGDGALDSQFARFTALALVILALDLLLLRFFVEVAGVPRIPAQGIAILLLVPASFLGNRLWSFGRRA